ncbi:hypothetical protein ACFCYB_00385 [Streptomyces sp. NPDC056309]|uniref:hypothetical protein n=1 Tax=Streptomyces sp. NPDC056309 TaxID=3345781 RepID=UPI0035D89EAB
MTVALLPPVTSAPADFLTGAEALLEGPRFVRTRGMTRWHRPRSGVRYGDGRLVYQLWCTGGVQGSFLACDAVPDGDVVCGLCDGKAVGAGQDTGPDGRQLVFSPRHVAPPKTCPGSRSSNLYAELPGGRAGRCLACSDVHPLRAMGGPYNPRYAIVQHPTGPGLVPPCPFHRWRQLTARDGRVLCACGRALATA